MAVTLARFEVEVPGGVKKVEIVSQHTTVQQYIKCKSKTPAGRDDVEDAFRVADLGRIMDIHENWMRTMPNVQPFYAMKANDDIMLLKTLAALDTGFDYSNMNEIKTILDLGVSSDRIIYANTIKQVSHLLWAKENKVDLMTFDNDYELLKISKHFPAARLVIRLQCDSPEALYPLGNKFGCTYDVAKKLLQLAKSLKLNVVGVSFHVGSLCMSPASYQDAIELAYKVFQYAEGEGYYMTLLDIGGGFHGRKDEQSSMLFKETAEHVRKGLEKFSNIRDLKVIAEPGTFYASSSYAVATNIIGKRTILTESEEVLAMYYLNDGTYGTMYCANYPSYVYWFEPTPLKDVSPMETKLRTTLWGPTCDSGDKIRECELPELEVGDWIYFDDIGAYSVSVDIKFNGQEKPVLYYYINESKSDDFQRLIRSKEQLNGVDPTLSLH